MPMVCPQCNRSFEQQLLCPTCNTRLLYHAHLRSGTEAVANSDLQWQHTPWGRILVGVVLSQGLAHGLQLIFLAGLQATGEDANGLNWNDPGQVIFVQALHGLSLLLGAILTGAGQRRGVFYGSIVGLLHGLITLGTMQWRGEALPEITLCAVPALHMAFGAAGGLLGSLIWRPLPTVQFAVQAEPRKNLHVAAVFTIGFTALAGRIAWLRVGLGVAIAVFGVLWSSAILQFILENAPTRLMVESVSQYQLFSSEIAALATFLAAGFAGATTTNGLKQGLCVGMGTGVLLTGFQLAKANPDMQVAGLTIISALLLSIAGGWFGGQLFPKIYARPRRRSRILTEAN
jgi:type IV secretory pathway VirB2 component (pilin)